MVGDLRVADAQSKLWYGEQKKGQAPKARRLRRGLCSLAGRESLEICAATLSLPPLALQGVRGVLEELAQERGFAPAGLVLACLRPCTSPKQALPQAPAEKPGESVTGLRTFRWRQTGHSAYLVYQEEDQEAA